MSLLLSTLIDMPKPESIRVGSLPLISPDVLFFHYIAERLAAGSY
jgi:hypothetical protein